MESGSSLSSLISNSTLISQGAEAKIYISDFPFSSQQRVVIKHRFSKTYRHPSLDAILTKTRLSSEARTLVRCLKYGIPVPQVRFVDLENGVIGMECIEGASVRKILGGGDDDAEEDNYDRGQDAYQDVHDQLKHYYHTLESLTHLIGTTLAKLHRANIIHGDLTTSNMLLRSQSAVFSGSTPAELVLIDFGLSSTSSLPEDKAVDLYVLERAFSSTHPGSNEMFKEVLNGYKKGSGKDWDHTWKRLEEVRMRGRKRSMVG